MATLTKTQTLLHLQPGNRRKAPVFRPSLDDGETPLGYEILLDRDVFEELGCPSTITVTIEPGDLLND